MRRPISKRNAIPAVLESNCYHLAHEPAQPCALSSAVHGTFERPERDPLRSAERCAVSEALQCPLWTPLIATKRISVRGSQ